MAERRETKKFVFSVEGETEKWYLEWLQRTINECADSSFKADINAKVENSPMKFVKTINAKTTPFVTHLCDVEGQTLNDLERFETILKEIRNASKQKGIKYKIGYSNLSFELWMILHKQDYFCGEDTKNKYLIKINSSFSESFEKLDDYKEKSNFKKCLNKLSLQDVKDALGRADKIMKNNLIDRKHSRNVSGFVYYLENPSLSIHLAVKTILTECGVNL